MYIVIWCVICLRQTKADIYAGVLDSFSQHYQLCLNASTPNNNSMFSCFISICKDLLFFSTKSVLYLSYAYLLLVRSGCKYDWIHNELKTSVVFLFIVLVINQRTPNTSKRLWCRHDLKMCFLCGWSRSM